MGYSFARRLACCLVVGSGAIVLASPASALTRCKAKRLRDGSIVVNAREVVGTPHWGVRYGETPNDFDDTATCLLDMRARRCAIAPVGAPERTALPASCTLYVSDDTASLCSAWVRRCLPSSERPLCAIFPVDNVWNRDISSLPVHPMSDVWVGSIGTESPLHPDFGAGPYFGATIGIPYTLVSAAQPLVPISFTYADESDPGPYPIPALVAVEGGGTRPSRGRGDAHVLLVQQDTCMLYEIFAAEQVSGAAAWTGGSGAVFDLGSNSLRPGDWTSGDAAGLPILAGLIRYDEILAGAVTHAVRFTATVTQRAYVWPARHFASTNTDSSVPPMGIRVRLKASVDISGFSATNQIILTGLKRYGMMLADNGAPWFISGAPDQRWDNEDLHALTTLRGSDFEVVDVSSLMVDPDSGQALP